MKRVLIKCGWLVTLDPRIGLWLRVDKSLL
jgi:hypothetical protein